MADTGSKDNDKLIAEIIARIVKLDVPDSVKQEGVNAVKNIVAKGTEQAMSNTELGKNIFTKLFPQLGLESAGEGKGFTLESKLGAGSKVFGGFADGMIKMLKTGLTILEDIYKKLVEASPLLQAVESLFNLAMQLFFMPLGNKLAEELIPAALQMIDDVMEMWDEMKDMNLDQILDKTINKFADIFIGFMKNIGNTLSKHGGILGAIGGMINMIADFMIRHLPGMMHIVRNIMTFIGQNFPLLIATIVAFKIAAISLLVLQTIASIDHGLIENHLKAAILIPAALAIGGGALAAGFATGTIGGHADGGYVASPQLALLGEGGEGEWVVPDSKVSDFITSQSAARNLKVGGMKGLGGDNYTVNVYGYTDSELRGIVTDTVNDMSNRSRLRSGF